MTDPRDPKALDVIAAVGKLASLEIEDLLALQAEIQEEIDRRNQPRLYRMRCKPYNERQFYKPWVGRVISWDNRPVVEFGKYVADSEGGTASVTASPGDIITVTQKARRSKRNNHHWLVAEHDGTLREITEDEARAQWAKGDR